MTATVSTPPVQLRRFAIAAGALTLGFALPLWQLAVFADQDELHSYILLIPFLVAYLVWIQKEKLPAGFTPAKGWAAGAFGVGAVLLAWYWLKPATPVADRLAQVTAGYLFWLAGLAFTFLGGRRIRALWFPAAMAVFMIPLPDAARAGLEAVLQHGSAVVAGWMFSLSGMPVYRESVLTFRLPGISLMVAPECSGIRSTMVLFITSLVAGWMFLRQPWRRAALAAFVLPLALVRNAFRVFVLGELCIRIGPHMIDSPVHHHGGPLFFALSLIPFVLMLWWLRRSEMRAATPAPPK